MNTFEMAIPARLFMDNGGNIMKSTILLSNDLKSLKYSVATRSENMLEIKNSNNISRTHIDMCWVICKVIVD